MPIGLIDILKLAGLDPSLRTKLVRHQDRRYPIEELRRRGWFELYQSYQSKPRFHDTDQIISFYGLPETRAGFFGVYQVVGHRAGSDGDQLEACPWSKRWREGQYFYDLRRDERFDDLRDRLIIDWGPGALAWVQNLTNKPVMEILEPGRKLPPFEDYLEFNLDYDALRDLYDNEHAHRDWQVHLSAVAGVYLILAQTTGDLYVGSAYGAAGVWGRWREYAASGHGSNKRLRELIDRDPAYPGQFRFSLLQILPKSMSRDEVIARETKYKYKLGTRESLNS